MSNRKKVSLNEIDRLLTQHHKLEAMLQWIDEELDRMKSREPGSAGCQLD